MSKKFLHWRFGILLEPFTVVCSHCPNLTDVELDGRQYSRRYFEILVQLCPLIRKVKLIQINNDAFSSFAKCKHLTSFCVLGCSESAPNITGLLENNHSCASCLWLIVQEWTIVSIVEKHITSQGVIDLLKDCPLLDCFNMSGCSQVEGTIVPILMTRMRYMNVLQCGLTHEEFVLLQQCDQFWNFEK